MKLYQLTKSELQQELIELQQLAMAKVSRKGRYYRLAEGFLEDLEQFSKVLKEIPDLVNFKLISPNSDMYKRKQVTKILFDSFSIVLLQDNDEFYVYRIAKYKLK